MGGIYSNGIFKDLVVEQRLEENIFDLLKWVDNECLCNEARQV